MPTSYPATAAVSRSRPEAPSACATASTGGKTTVPGWNTEPLCTSSCSTMWAAAALTMAAKTGEVLRRETSTSAGPSAGPMAWANLAIDSTGRERAPARIEPSVSSKRSSQRRSTLSGMSS